MTSPDVVYDLVVVLPGIMGSTLAKDGELIWAPSAGAVLKAITKFGVSIHDAVLPTDIGDDHPHDGVAPVALMPDLHVLPGIWSAHIGYEKLMEWLSARFHLLTPSAADPSRIPNLIPVPYDWRLSNRYNGRRLKTIVEPALEKWRSQGAPFSDAKIIFICHSMGGLVARWYIEKEGGAALTRKLITLGTPYRGALNALDQLVNGVRKGVGPLKIDVTTFARSLPSVHQLLPEYACIASGSKLLKTTEVTLPHLNKALVADAMKFHDDLDAAAASGKTDAYDVHPIVGFRQRTFTTAEIVGDAIEPVETIGGDDLGGDATVPRLAAAPKNVRLDSPVIRYIADQHGSLQSNGAVLDELQGILTARPVVYKAAPRHELGVWIEPVALVGERIAVEATVAGGARIALQAQVKSERGKEMMKTSMQPSGGVYRATLEGLPAGAYHVVIDGAGSMKGMVVPVTATILIWG